MLAGIPLVFTQSSLHHRHHQVVEELELEDKDLLTDNKEHKTQAPTELEGVEEEEVEVVEEQELDQGLDNHMFLSHSNLHLDHN